jgi:hypothetical protein
MMNFMAKPLIIGHRATEFYVQLHDDDLFILVIPTTFKAILFVS